MKRLVTYFLQGLLFVAPLVITGYIVYKIFILTDGLLSTYLEKYFGNKTPGLGILIICVLLVLLGMIGETIVARPFKQLINGIIDRTPFLKLIYSSINDLFTAFIGKERKFHRPVLAQLDRENQLWKIGFITQDVHINIEGTELITVYFPFSYAVTGEICFLPPSQVKPLDLPPAEAMKFIVSGGVSGSEALHSMNKRMTDHP